MAELAQRRHEPDWLLALRLRAFEAFERMPLPDQRTEGWRRTSLRGLDLDSFDPLELTASPSIAPSNGFVIDLQEALQDPRLAERIEESLSESDPRRALLVMTELQSDTVALAPDGPNVNRARRWLAAAASLLSTRER